MNSHIVFLVKIKTEYLYVLYLFRIFNYDEWDFRASGKFSPRLNQAMSIFSMPNKFRIDPNGSDGLTTVIKLVVMVAVASVPMLAGAEETVLKSTSEKPMDVTRKKIELRALPRPATVSIEQCEQILSGVTDLSDQVKRVSKTLKKNLHFRPLGDGHLIFRPGWYAGYNDIVAAHSSLNEDDIPVLVSLVGRGKLAGGMRSIGFGVLGMFGAKAVPCIDAGMAIYPEHASDLFAIRGNIEVNHQYPDPSRSASNPKPDQPHLETPKGGKQR